MATTSTSLVLALLVGAPAQAEPDDAPADQPAVESEDVPSAEEITAEVSDDAHPVESEVDLVTFAPAEESDTAESGGAVGTDEAATSDEPAETDEAAPFGIQSQGLTDAEDGTDDTVGGAEELTATDGGQTQAPESEAPAATEEPESTEEPETTEAPADEPTEAPETDSPESTDTVVIAAADTPELAVVGVTWDAGAPADLAVDVRTLTTDGWTEWEELEIDNRLADEDLTDRQGTEPLAVVDASQIEVRLTTAEAAPTGANLSVIDPGTSTADSAPVTAAAMSTTATARPTIYSRAQWGADESIRTWAPEVGRVTGIDIHHTAGVNGYSSSQVPSILRGIYAYHAEEWGRDWGDIGYNVLVDRFGRAWEGRYGGLDQAIIGAHATGLNGNMAGISLIGNYDTVAVPTALFDMVARVAAWKLSIHGTTPHGTTTFDGNTWNRIVGHRDAKQTTCPGQYMYSRLDELKNRIAAYQGSFSDRELNRDLDGDGAADLVVRQGTNVSLMSTAPTLDWTVERIGHGWTPSRTTIAGDWNGDGTVDMMLRTADGSLLLYAGRPDGSVSNGVRVGWGWTAFNLLIGGDDWNGDGHLDLLARHTNGTLWLYASDGRGNFHRGVQIGSGWNGMESISMADGFIGGRPTILGVHGSNGHLYAYSSNGRGAITGTVTVSSSWNGVTATAGVADLTGDGRSDLVAVSQAGELLIYPGSGTGTVRPRGVLDTGWNGTTMILDAGARSAGRIFYRLDTGGVLYRATYGAVAPGYAELTPTGITVAASDLDVVPVGDWNGDGRADLVVRRASGALMLHLGTGGGRFAATGTQIGNGWQSFDAIVGAGNWRGDGLPGIVAYSRADAKAWLYSATPTGTFSPSVLVMTNAPSIYQLANVGQWNGAGAVDLIARAGTRLHFYNGTGAGLAVGPTEIGSGWGSFNSLVGVNDVTSDGVSDLVAVTTSGQIMLYPGNGLGRFLSGRLVGTVPSGAEVS
ncbi:FG-GAP-like repeat-containing protein [Occultella gossypii]|uniref:N-acetylmuramoyl-L-alanine amidase n=1 Tax=Occultella gossypii TaxID=2800820 RepID=A0ABS7S9P0_9MICO|nr:FG-GAP-like repeat-containing protein [Occultella gossypii]MBZ2196465.1 N-acetylmuramoyl-L-alanine amidase [Occultella gossypii]